MAEFSRLFSQQRQEEDKIQQTAAAAAAAPAAATTTPTRATTTTTPTRSSSSPPPPQRKNPSSSPSPSSRQQQQQQQQQATECLLYGYRNKDSEWKVIDRFERISRGYICEDYSRTDPRLSTGYTNLLSGGDVVIRNHLTPDANRKSKRYAGGFHWIKVTFDSRDSADRAIEYSPQEIDGCFVFCRLYDEKPVLDDIALPRGAPETEAAIQAHRRHHPHSLVVPTNTAASTANTTSTNPFFQPKAFPASGHGQRLFGRDAEDEAVSLASSTTGTASSTTATGFEPPSSTIHHRKSTASSTATPEQQTQQQQQQQQQQPPTHMKQNPSIRRAKLRPINEALPPQPTVLERFFRSIPILSWFTGDVVGDGPQLREDGSFDYEKSNIYWRFWYCVDQFIGTDICGLRGDS